MDLFDRLQDELLVHIISFLPTKYAVLTSVLSERWRFLWCYADKSLVFDDSVFLHGRHDEVGYYGLNVDDYVLPFKNFVDRVLKFNKAPQIKNFSLKMYPSQDRLNPVEPWLNEIVSTRQAKEIHIQLGEYVCLSSVAFPLETFHSASLRVLKLYLGYDGPISVSSSNSKRLFLPNLKVLHFWTFGICRKLWLFNYLFRSAPQLEEAYFGGYLQNTKRFCNIYAPSLKRLRMKFQSVGKSNKFLINAPILEDLVVVDQSFQQLVIKSNRIVTAKLDFGFPYVKKFRSLRVHIHRVCKLLCRISHVKLLNLRAHTMDALSVCCNSTHSNLIPQFSALCHLKLCFLNYSSWDVIPKLLDCTPNLQVLAISKDFKDKDAHFRKDSIWIQPSRVSICLLSSLREIQVSDCGSHQVEFDLINYLLKHGDVLSTFLVELLPADSRDDLWFKDKLMLIPRASRTCELKVSVYAQCSQHSSPQDDKIVWPVAKLQQRIPPLTMCHEDLRLCTDYFSDDHLIIRTKEFKIYRGKLYQSSPSDPTVTDVVVKKWVIPAQRPYAKNKENSMRSFREELKLLEHPNFKYHPYFMSVLGYCAEDYGERLAVVYNCKPLDCLKNLIPKDSFKWLQRIKVALVVACSMEYMHKNHEDLHAVRPRLCPSTVILDEDYTPAFFSFVQKRGNYIDMENDQYDDSKSVYSCSLRDADVRHYGLTLLGLISKRIDRYPNDRDYKSERRTMDQWARVQFEDRYLSSSLCKSQIPLVHRSLMDDSTYDIVDGLKITRLVMRCLSNVVHRPSMHGIVKCLCKLRVVRENWDVLDCDSIIGDHLNLL